MEVPEGMRVTLDIRALNAVTENLAYPTEDVKNIVRSLATKQVYSVADLKDGYYNVKLRKKDRPLTAVTTVLGLFEYAVMAQGLKDACAFFQKMVNEVYMGLRFTGENEVENVCAVMAAYLDDLAVGSDSAAVYLVDLEAVLERTRGAGLKLKLSKCLFGKRSVELLGHRVSHGLVRPSDDHTAVFANFKEPRNASELLRFIGLVIFFGEHVESAADRLAPLYEVLVGTSWNRKKRKNRRWLSLIGRRGGRSLRSAHSKRCVRFWRTRIFLLRRDHWCRKNL
jgi:Reverse transcriptase (RNA-dependent DNA polymerase)